MSRVLYLGLMSGTSMDGIDAVLVRFEGTRTRVRDHLHHAYPESLRCELRQLASEGRASLDDIAHADIAVARQFADAAIALMAQAGVDSDAVTAIGSHGQTIRHAPRGTLPYTWQLGDPATIAVRTGVPTAGGFRQADVAAGGEGAPLVPPFHATCFGTAREDRAVVNIGGIANATLLYADGSLRGFDCGPGNTLLDAWMRQSQGKAFDADGAYAAGGTVCEPLLAALLREPYFREPPPKSTGPEHFSPAWLDAALAGLQHPPEPRDIQATLAELTARTVTEALLTHAPGTARVLVCGGGAYNRDLMRRLATHAAPRPVTTTAAFGVAPEHVEAAAMAWLARHTVRRQAGNDPRVTGAAGPVVLGSVHYGRRTAQRR